MREWGVATADREECGIEVAIEGVGLVAAVGEDSVEEGCGSGCCVETGGEAEGGFGGGAPGEAQAGLPLLVVAGDVLCGDAGDEGGVDDERGRGGWWWLRVPLSCPTDACGEEECGAEGNAEVGVEGEVVNGGVVAWVGGDRDGLLEAAWVVVEIVGDGGVVEAGVEVGLAGTRMRGRRRSGRRR
jgi:hypothetical protein